MPPARQPFSKRQGYTGQPKEITTWEDAPRDLRFSFLEITRTLFQEYRGQYPETEIREVVAKTLQKWMDSAVWHYQEVWEQVERVVYDCTPSLRSQNVFAYRMSSTGLDATVVF